VSHVQPNECLDDINVVTKRESWELAYLRQRMAACRLTMTNWCFRPTSDGDDRQLSGEAFTRSDPAGDLSRC
jgi:hypothetical protein